VTQVAQQVQQLELKADGTPKKRPGRPRKSALPAPPPPPPPPQPNPKGAKIKEEAGVKKTSVPPPQQKRQTTRVTRLSKRSALESKPTAPTPTSPAAVTATSTAATDVPEECVDAKEEEKPLVNAVGAVVEEKRDSITADPLPSQQDLPPATMEEALPTQPSSATPMDTNITNDSPVVENSPATEAIMPSVEVIVDGRDLMTVKADDERAESNTIEEASEKSVKDPKGDPLGNFTVIDKNFICCNNPPKGESFVCQCSPPEKGKLGCKDDCHNRAVWVACGERCPAGKRCSN